MTSWSMPEAEPVAVPDAGDASSAPRPRWKRVRSWAIDVAVVIVVFVGISAWQARKLLPAGGEAPAFQLETLDGGTVALSDYAGRAVQLHFWATWCGVCGREHGALNAVARGDDHALVAIAVDSGAADAIRTYALEHGIEYTVAIDDGTVAAAYQVGSFPTNYYLDPAHTVVGKDVGMATRWAMRWRLSRARRH